MNGPIDVEKIAREAMAPRANAEPHYSTVVPLAFASPADLAGLPIPERRWVIPGWLPAATVTLLYGAGGEGKTLLTQQLMTSVASGTPWLGLQVRQGCALGLFSEDDPEEMHRRQHDINRAQGVDYTDLADMFWTCPVGSDNTLLRFDADSTPRPTERWAQLRDEAVKLQPSVIVLDVAADLYGGNENDRGQVAQFLKALLGNLARETGAAVVVNAHPSKSSISSGDLDSGSTGWNGGVRTRLTLATPKPEEGAPADDTVRILRKAKANYARRGDELELVFRDGAFWAKETLGNGIVAAIERRKCEEVFLDLLDAFTEQNRRLSHNPHAGNFAPKLFAQDPKANRYKAGDFRRAMSKLFDEKAIELQRYGKKSDETFKLVRAGSDASGDSQSDGDGCL